MTRCGGLSMTGWGEGVGSLGWRFEGRLGWRVSDWNIGGLERGGLAVCYCDCALYDRGPLIWKGSSCLWHINYSHR